MIESRSSVIVKFGNRCSSGAARRRAAHAAFSRSLTNAHASTHFSHPCPSQTIPLSSPQPLSPSSLSQCTLVHLCSNRCTSPLFHPVLVSLTFSLVCSLLLLHTCSSLPHLSALFLSFFSSSSSSVRFSRSILLPTATADDCTSRSFE